MLHSPSRIAGLMLLALTMSACDDSVVITPEEPGTIAATADLTVFAPTNEAFAALSAVPSGQALTDVLTYHVLDSEVASGDLSDGLQVTNTLLAGGAFTVNISGSDVTITDGAGNTVNVIITDVPASNGIIHVIDAVLLPTP